MTWLPRTIAAVALVAGLLGSAAAFAQAPPPVPGLPDTERRVSYGLNNGTCICSLGFALYGDGTDYQNWVEVWLNGVRVNFNDISFGWTITSPTGPLATIPRPITDAVLTFTNPQTGTIQIIGARRPRRTSQFNENRGVAARDLNQVVTDLTATEREFWDKINDVSGRTIQSQPGITLGNLPLPATCANTVLGFDSSGLNPICQTVAGSLTAASLLNHDQTLSGGANVTSFNLGPISSGTTTIDCGFVSLQYLTDNGAFTLAAPALDGSCLVLVTNGASAGTITFSGFSVGVNTGDNLDTVNGHKFTINIWRINGTAGYRVAGHQ